MLKRGGLNREDLGASHFGVISPVLINIFQDLHLKLKNNSAIDTQNSGSTGVVVVMSQSAVICSSVGDSQAFIYKKSQSADDSLYFEELTTVHSADDSQEALRIVNNGGSVRRAVNQYGEPSGPLRVFKGNTKIPGLMMTRSFGDKLGHSVGMNCIPSTP